MFTFEVDAVDLTLFLVEAAFHLIELGLILVLKFGLTVAVLVDVAVQFSVGHHLTFVLVLQRVQVIDHTLVFLIQVFKLFLEGLLLHPHVARVSLFLLGYIRLGL